MLPYAFLFQLALLMKFGVEFLYFVVFRVEAFFFKSEQILQNTCVSSVLSDMMICLRFKKKGDHFWNVGRREIMR